MKFIEVLPAILEGKHVVNARIFAEYMGDEL